MSKVAPLLHGAQRGRERVALAGGRALDVALGMLLSLCVIWWVAALYYAGPRPLALSLGIAAAYALGAGVLFWRLPAIVERLAVVAAAALLPLAWWVSLEPSNDRDWAPEVSRLPWFEVEGSRLTAHDLRDFHYRSENDFDARWIERSYDLDALEGVDIFLSYWGSPAIAHTILSWDFAGSPPLAVSIETRKSKGESYSTLAGFFKQYELIYIAADERDVIQLRTTYRGETVYIYRTAIPLERARALLLDYIAAMNRLRSEPRFYNALLHNCTTSIVIHARHVAERRNPLDWRMVVNGYSDAMMYERGLLDRSLPFEGLRGLSEINARARAGGDQAEFSRLIRVGLPDPRGPARAP